MPNPNFSEIKIQNWKHCIPGLEFQGELKYLPIAAVTGKTWNSFGLKLIQFSFNTFIFLRFPSISVFTITSFHLEFFILVNLRALGHPMLLCCYWQTTVCAIRLPDIQKSWENGHYKYFNKLYIVYKRIQYF